MFQKYILLFLLFLSLSATSQATIHTGVDAGLSFSPATLNINVGDTVVWNIAAMHTVVEVSQTTWNNNGNTSNGGFVLPNGGGTVIFPIAGTYYYVCGPHAASGMKGIVNVVLTTLMTGSIIPTTRCKGAAVLVPYTATGAFTGANVFSAQLSDAVGSFASPTVIGTLNSSTSGQISATIPGGTPTGTGYRIRVVSSAPALTANNNGADLSVLDVPSAMITPAGPTTFCDGLDVTLNANTGAGLTYIWRLNGNVINGATAASHTATLAGLYTVEVSNGTCATLSAAVRVTIIPTNPTTLTWTGASSSDWATVGNWDNPCAIPTAGDTVIIGPTVAPPTGIPAITLNKLTVNHSTGIALTNDLQLNGTLALTSGNLTLGSANLMLAANASISGGSAASHIVTNGTGELRQAGIGSGGRTGAILFPVGPDGSTYSPASVSNSGTQDEFRVLVKNDVLEDGTTGSALSGNVVGKTWFISEATPGGSTAILTLQWDIAHELSSFDRSACYVAHHNGTDWVPLQALGAASGSSPFQRTVSGVTAFSPFAVGDGNSPLPVSYRTLTADVDGDAVVIRWETEQEVNNAGFEIERSEKANGQWEMVAFVSGTGEGSHGASYMHVDVPPTSGGWFYRLRQIDMDGRHELSRVLAVSIGEPLRELAIESVYPNPAQASVSHEVTLAFTAAENGPVQLSMHDMLGRRVAVLFDGLIDASGQGIARFNIADIPPGMYLYRLDQGAHSVILRTVIVR